MSEAAARYVLAFNAGSSSLKFELFEHDRAWRSRLRGAVRDIGRERPVLEVDGSRVEASVSVASHAEAADVALDAILDGESRIPVAADRIDVAGHRIVHGGGISDRAALVTPALLGEIEIAGRLAPLHNPPALAALAVARERLPRVPAVAVFDTAFFRRLPDHVNAYAVPQEWREHHGIRRFGFHGIAHAYLSDRVRGLLATAAAKRVITLHLGQGCSATAIDDGRPVETSMGFTPLEGLVMGTRSGDLDPGAILHMAHEGRSWETLEAELNRESGLRGLSGASDDVRELLELEGAGHAGAALALEAFCHRVRKYIGAYAAVLGGLDALVFGGGIGENAPRIRTRVCKGSSWLGLELDETANARCIGAEGRISTSRSAIDVHVIRVHEEEAIARAALECADSSVET